MKHEDQVAMVRRVIAHVEDGTTTYAEANHRNPVSVYTCPDRFRREQETIFRKWPLLVGLSGLVGKPGDYATEDLAGIPLLLTRDRDGRVRAFANICRHRGARLVEGCGHANRLVCPYHAWTYGLDGALKGVPSGKDFDAVDKAGHGLKELHAVEKYGLIFVQPEGEPVDIDEAMGGLQRDIEDYGFESFHPYRHATIRREMNWKLSPETFMEAYHFETLHRNTVAPIFFPNLMPFDAFGRNSRLIVPRKRILELKDRPSPSGT
ncbi:MAG: aromatic ring-hydroxylating oxygenase subunit alpha [Minwuia sp.]|uniref:aromatic ring-hydroxylating oxygenase subunit alpha n=1 Tax=Minwuia sp. TaxID=2493630 RepID=UPI003A8944D7